METSKSCSKCKEVKPLSDFRKQKSTKDGYKYVCRKCDNDVQKQRYTTKKPDYIAKVKEWQAKNPDKVKLYKNKSREKSLT